MTEALKDNINHAAEIIFWACVGATALGLSLSILIGIVLGFAKMTGLNLTC